VGRETDALTFLAALAEAPHRYDFYQTMRRLECLFADKPRWGQALRPVDEPVRLGQEPDMSFAPAPLASFDQARNGRPPRLHVRLFGLLGPNGPLPLHVTEYARERLRHAGDPTLSRFLDVLHHRFLAFFYRAWAQAQPHVNRDRPADDRFGSYIGAFFGVAPANFRGRDGVPDVAKFFHVGALIRQVRNAEGLAALLQHFFRVPVRLQEFVGHRLRLAAGERTYLGRDSATLARGAVVGGSVWDRQSKFRVRVGPLSLRQYEAFLPGGTELPKLVDWVRMYLCYELDWDVRLELHARDVPRPTLGGGCRLGWTTWVGRRPRPVNADDLCLDAEGWVDRSGNEKASGPRPQAPGSIAATEAWGLGPGA
jgi:type VI secretion system protein ImpH